MDIIYDGNLNECRKDLDKHYETLHETRRNLNYLQKTISHLNFKNDSRLAALLNKVDEHFLNDQNNIKLCENYLCNFSNEEKKIFSYSESHPSYWLPNRGEIQSNVLKECDFIKLQLQKLFPNIEMRCDISANYVTAIKLPRFCSERKLRELAKKSLKYPYQHQHKLIIKSSIFVKKLDIGQ
jgi:hypothetical protein